MATASKITKLEQQMRDGKPSGFKITLADGTNGYLDEKNSEKGLRDGDDVFYEAVTPEGKNYKKISCNRTNGGQAPTPQPSFKPAGGQSPSLSPSSSFQPQSVFTAKANATVKAMEFVIDMFIADKMKWDEIKPKHKELTGYLNDAIDECNS